MIHPHLRKVLSFARPPSPDRSVTVRSKMEIVWRLPIIQDVTGRTRQGREAETTATTARDSGGQGFGTDRERAASARGDKTRRGGEQNEIPRMSEGACRTQKLWQAIFGTSLFLSLFQRLVQFVDRSFPLGVLRSGGIARWGMLFPSSFRWSSDVRSTCQSRETPREAPTLEEVKNTQQQNPQDLHPTPCARKNPKSAPERPKKSRHAAQAYEAQKAQVAEYCLVVLKLQSS